ncbi:MAG: hypothetical protein ACC656_15765, partial [Candidatus Heimdallarchaeota archaeon]
DTLNLYVQIDIPENASQLFEEILQTLQQLKLFESYSSFETYATAESNFDMIGWEIWKNRRDSFLQYVQNDRSSSDVFSSPSYIEFLWKDFLEENESHELEIGLPVGDTKLSKLDALLIRELTINAKIPITELAERYNRDRTTITRHMKKINLIMPKHQLYYDMNAFGMTNSVIIKGEFNEDLDFNINNFNSFIKSNRLPLNTNLVMNNDSFMWYIAAPPTMIPELTYFSWNLTSSHKIYRVYTQTAKKYFFNSNLVDVSGKWVIQRDILIDEPFDKLEKLM